MESHRERTVDADKFKFANLGDANLEHQFEIPGFVQVFMAGKIWRKRHREDSVRPQATRTAAANST